jgi:hypothetical protein
MPPANAIAFTGGNHYVDHTAQQLPLTPEQAKVRGLSYVADNLFKGPIGTALYFHNSEPTLVARCSLFSDALNANHSKSIVGIRVSSQGNIQLVVDSWKALENYQFSNFSYGTPRSLNGCIIFEYDAIQYGEKTATDLPGNGHLSMTLQLKDAGFLQTSSGSPFWIKEGYGSDGNAGSSEQQKYSNVYVAQVDANTDKIVDFFASFHKLRTAGMFFMEVKGAFVDFDLTTQSYIYQDSHSEKQWRVLPVQNPGFVQIWQEVISVL